MQHGSGGSSFPALPRNVVLHGKVPRSLVALSSFMLALIALGGLGHRYRITSSVLMVALMLVVFVVINRATHASSIATAGAAAES